MRRKTKIWSGDEFNEIEKLLNYTQHWFKIQILINLLLWIGDLGFKPACSRYFSVLSFYFIKFRPSILSYIMPLPNPVFYIFLAEWGKKVKRMRWHFTDNNRNLFYLIVVSRFYSFITLKYHFLNETSLKDLKEL